MKNKDEKNTMTESPDVIIGEVLPDEKADGKKKQLVPRKSDKVFPAPQRTENPFYDAVQDRSAP